MDELLKIEAPPDGLNADDLATTLLYHMGVGRNQANMLAAAEALRIKGSQKKWTVSKAYIHIYQRWAEYKGSDHYRSQFRRGAAAFLNEGDYDNPAMWGGSEVKQAESYDLDPMVKEMRDLKRDRQLHPEKYLSEQELGQLWRDLSSLTRKKRMPAKKSDIRPMQIDPERNRDKLKTQAEMLMQKAAASNCSTVGSRHSFTEENNGPEQEKVLE